MRVLYISHALTVAAHRDKLGPLAAAVDLDVVIPDRWPGEFELGEGFGPATPRPVWFAGKNHFHLYERPSAFLDARRIDLVHIDEEPYSAVTFQLMRACTRRDIPAVFFTWQTIVKRLPWPFQATRRWVLRNAAGAIAGTASAAKVLRALGFERSPAVIPQFGIDPDRFRPDPLAREQVRGELGIAEDAFVMGFAGRLVKEKGLHVLLAAAAKIPGVRVIVVGDGDVRPPTTGIPRSAIHVVGRVRSTDMPRWLNAMDVLVLPSLTTPSWEEQFGRVLIEAMACGVPVVGSDSGQIPTVIEEAGVIVPEGDVDALVDSLTVLQASKQQRDLLAARGRRRVLEHFTNERVVEATVRFYEAVRSAT